MHFKVKISCFFVMHKHTILAREAIPFARHEAILFVKLKRE